jgi:hypothetical protein
MSLGGLPTELDVVILDYLDRNDVSCVSRVSKYYRKLAEPLLYHDIQLHTHEHDRIKRLLITLVNRKDLCQRIRRFNVRCGPKMAVLNPLESADEDLYNKLMSNASKINEAICEMAAQGSFPPILKLETFASVFKPNPFYDGALAVILCMSTRILSLHLHMTYSEPLSLTRRFLGFPWLESSADQDGCPFWALTNLCLEGFPWADDYHDDGYLVPFTPSMETLHVIGNSSLEFILPSQRTMMSTASLSSLILKDVNIDPVILETIVHMRYFRHIKSLLVCGVGQHDYCAEDDCPWDDYDYSKLKKAMQEGLPLLECFTWTDMLCENPQMKPFRSFAGFQNLKKLAIDHLLFWPKPDEPGQPENVPSVAMLRQYFPPGLELFELGGLDWCTLNSLFQEISEVADVMPELTSIASFLASLHINRITLAVDMECSGSEYGHSLRTGRLHEQLTTDTKFFMWLYDIAEAVQKFEVVLDVQARISYHHKTSERLATREEAISYSRETRADRARKSSMYSEPYFEEEEDLTEDDGDEDDDPVVHFPFLINPPAFEDEWDPWGPETGDDTDAEDTEAEDGGSDAES